MTDGRWTEDGWKRGEEKLHRIQNEYPLVMDIRLRKLSPHEKYIGQLPDRVQYQPPALTSSTASETPNKRAVEGAATDDYGDDDYDDGGRSPNDDRSDSMNPNNDAYWSSRGR